MHQELTLAEKSAEVAYRESGNVHAIMQQNRAVDDAATKRHFRNVITNAQLKDIAVAQVGWGTVVWNWHQGGLKLGRNEKGHCGRTGGQGDSLVQGQFEAGRV